MDTANDIINELIALIDKKTDYFKSIMDITLEQKKDIFENEARNIEELVNKKQAVIDKISEIDSAFSDKLDMLKKDMNIASLENVDFTKYPLLKTIKHKVENIAAKAQNISDIEKENRERLLVIFDGLKKELKRINVGKKSIRAYETPVINNDGIYIDRKK